MNSKANERYLKRKRLLSFIREDTNWGYKTEKKRVNLLCVGCGEVVQRTAVIKSPVCFQCKNEKTKARNRSQAQRNIQNYLKRKLSTDK